MEHIYQDVGSCGPFQVVHLLLLQTTRFATVWALYLMMFGNYDPGWKCVRHRQTVDLNASFTTVVGCGDNNCTNSTMSHRNPHDSLAPNKSFLSYDYLNISNSRQTMANSSDSCDSIAYCEDIEFDSSSKTIVSEFGLICDQSYVPSVIICIQMVGMLVGAYVSGQLGEWFGRKVSLYSSTALCSVCSLLAIFSPSWQVYAAVMFFIGAGSSGIMVTNGVYMMEFLNPKWRGRMTGLPTWNISLAAFAVAVFILRNWVYIHIATACLACAACLGALWSPESLRWLLVHGKEKRAAKVVHKIIKANSTSAEVADVMEKLSTARCDNRIDRKYTYLDLFRDRFLLWLSFKSSVIWFVVALSYYALSFSVKTLAGDFYINVLIAGISEIPPVMLAAPLATTFGRRWTLTAFMLIVPTCCTVIVISYFTVASDVYGYVMTYSAFLAKASLVATMNVVIVFTAELYPTAVRNLGLAFLNMVSKTGAIVAPYLIPKDQRSLIISYVFIGVTAGVLIAVSFSLPETKNQPLRDGLRGDGDREMSTLEDVEEERISGLK